MRFAKWVFGVAGVYGLVNLGPQVFVENQIGLDSPPPITHPEYFYGFLGIGIAFQLVFLVIARDPVRFRPVMLPSVVEKLSFGIAAPVLYHFDRVTSFVFAFGLVDLLLAALFIAAYRKTPPA